MNPRRDPRELGFFRFIARQHVSTNLVSLFILLVGTILAFTITKEAFPQINFDMLIISTPFRGAAPEEVEQLVTTPLERAVKGIDGIDKMDSWSVEGNSVILIRLDPDYADKRKAIKKIEREVDRARGSELPEDGNEPEVTELEHVRAVLNVDLSGAPERELRTVARRLEDVLVEIDGVNKVTKPGYRKKQIWAEADEKKLAELHISLSDIINAIAASNHTSPGGRMIVGGKEILVRTMGRLKDSRDVRDVVVRSNVEGQQLRVRDVAEVTDTFERETTFTRINGTKSISVNVFKKPSGDSLEIAADVRKVVEAFRRRYPNVRFSYSNDITFYINRRLQVLLRNGTQGILLVLLCMILFLSPVSAVFTTLAIPIAFLGGLIIIHLLGYTVNLLSMFSFILVSGMLVDDGIVISEFYEKKREEGLSPLMASAVGTSQMAMPISVAVLTTIVAFMPLAFVSGIIGKFLRQFPVVVVAVLLVDLLECLLILPSHLALFADRIRFPRFMERMRSVGKGFMDVLDRVYTPALRWFVTHSATGTLLFVLLLVSVLIVSKMRLKFHMFPVSVDEFSVTLEMPMGTSLEKSGKVSAQFEKILGALPKHEIESIITTVGIAGEENRRRRGAHFAQSRVVLDKTGKRRRDGREILAQVRPRLEAAAKRLGVEKLELRQRRAGPPSGKAVEVRLIGDDYEQLSAASRKTQEFLKNQAGVFGISDDFTPGKEELLLDIDGEAVARAALHPAQVARVVRSAFNGEIATEIESKGTEEDIEVLVKLPEKARGDPKTLDRIRITNPRGRLVPLSQLTTRRKGTGYFFIPHSEGKRTITVSADVDQDTTSSGEVSAKVAAFLNALTIRNPELRYEFVGEEKDRVESVASLRRAMGIATLVIYTLMATLMGSFTLPIVIMSIIPFAFIGVFLTLLMHGLPLSMLVLIGLTGLMGVVVNNSILLVEAVVRLAREMPHLNLTERLIEAGRQRLRPIVLTSVTTFFGVAPLGYGIGGSEPFLEHVALTFGWGLLFTASITVFFVPTIYALGARIGRFLRLAPGEAPPTPMMRRSEH